MLRDSFMDLYDGVNQVYDAVVAGLCGERRACPDLETELQQPSQLSWRNVASNVIQASAPEGKYTVELASDGVMVSLEYELGKNSISEAATLLPSGEVLTERIILDDYWMDKSIKGIKGIPRLLANKEKFESIPDPKYRGLARLVLVEAEKAKS